MEILLHVIFFILYFFFGSFFFFFHPQAECVCWLHVKSRKNKLGAAVTVCLRVGVRCGGVCAHARARACVCVCRCFKVGYIGDNIRVPFDPLVIRRLLQLELFSWFCVAAEA